MEVLTLETLPKAFTHLVSELDEIKGLVQLRTEPHIETDQWVNPNKTCRHRSDILSNAAVYGRINASTLPEHKSGKKLRFLKSAIDAWSKRQKRCLQKQKPNHKHVLKIKKKGLTNGK